MLLHIVISSTRPGRGGVFVAQWFQEQAIRHEKFEISLLDLADFNLPLLDEPSHPKLQKYEHDHTRAWSECVRVADAFVFVMPEYNHSPSPALVNALDYLSKEWSYKPAAFVSYGGISGGLRAVQMTKLIVVGLKMMPILESVSIQHYAQYLDGERNFTPPASVVASVTPMLDELYRWAESLKALRAQHNAPLQASTQATLRGGIPLAAIPPAYSAE